MRCSHDLKCNIAGGVRPVTIREVIPGIHIHRTIIRTVAKVAAAATRIPYNKNIF